ncbi:MAG: tetratricopeptide repeat protein, partial [Bacteroidota bacterium]
APRQQEAMEQMYQAQLQFEKDSFALALSNPGGGFEGFLGIMDKYSGTAAANLAHYYAGISYLRLGEYEAAISYLEDFGAGDGVTPIMKKGAIGDAHSELGNMDKAISQYKGAISAGNNELLTPYYMKKLGLLYQKQGQNDQALSTFEKLKKEYPNAPDSRDIEKYIKRLAGNAS